MPTKAITDISPVLQAPAARTNGTANGATADLAGYESALVLFLAGTVTDGTHTPKLQHSADGSTWDDVPASDQRGTAAALATDTVQRVSYIGARRYLRAVITTAGATTGAIAGSVVLRGDAHSTPAA
jgi:hypothetical protein